MIKSGYLVGYDGMGYGDGIIVMAESIESAIITFKIEFPKRRVTKAEEIKTGIVVLSDEPRVKDVLEFLEREFFLPA